MMMRSISSRAYGQSLLSGFRVGVCLFEVAEDEDVLVVEGGCRPGVVQAAGDNEPGRR